MSNTDKTILDLCGGTGAWSRPYREAGYDVRLITLPDYDVRAYKPPQKVHGILAAPPCTEFSLAKSSLPRDFGSAFEIVRACLNIIWNYRIASELKFWCLENPRGFLRQFLGIPARTVRYWQFGDGLDKPTDLWGYYNFPRPIYTEPPVLIKSISSWPGKSAEKRAITPSGFAQAFFKANQ